MQLKFKTAMWHDEHELRQSFQISINLFVKIFEKEINPFIQGMIDQVAV